MILRRDTQREDEIKSIKAAWEELQPGRAAKVSVTNLTSIKYNISATICCCNKIYAQFSGTRLSISHLIRLIVKIFRLKHSEKSILPGKLRRKLRKARKKSRKKSQD